ncbi:MAG: tRNA (adenosine(37)-N6)-threonylcarbamoyltransferase complex ATPase subunit type 1 TsaE [Nitrospinales bacterium]
MKFKTSNADESQKLGERLGKTLSAGDTVLLFGDLGAGKTTFTQGIAAGLEVDNEDYVRSPTFTIINQYQGRHPIYHIDLYRIESYADIANLGLEELLYGDGILIIEWPEKLKLKHEDGTNSEMLIEERIEIKINILQNDMRVIEIKAINLSNSQHEVFSLQ